MSHFGELTPRMHDFREELLNAKPMVCVERAKITTQTYRENMDQPLAIRRALMYRNVLAGMSIFIEPQTLLAGNQASSNRAAPIFPEYAMDWVIEELDNLTSGTATASISPRKISRCCATLPPSGSTIRPRTAAWRQCRQRPRSSMIWVSSRQRGISPPGDCACSGQLPPDVANRLEGIPRPGRSRSSRSSI